MVLTIALAVVAAVIGFIAAAQILSALVLPLALILGVVTTVFVYGFVKGQGIGPRIGLPGQLTNAAFSVGAAALAGFIVYQFIVQTLFSLGLVTTAAIVVAVALFGWVAVQAVISSAVRGIFQ